MNEACHTLNEACHIWMRHVTYEWGMSHMNEACHIWKRHVTCFHMLNEACHTMRTHIIAEEWCVGESRSSNKMVCLLIMSRMNESCHTWKSHGIWMSRVTYKWILPYMNESCHVWMSHVTYEWVMSRMNESCHVWMSHVTFGIPAMRNHGIPKECYCEQRLKVLMRCVNP